MPTTTKYSDITSVAGMDASSVFPTTGQRPKHPVTGQNVFELVTEKINRLRVCGLTATEILGGRVFEQWKNDPNLRHYSAARDLYFQVLPSYKIEDHLFFLCPELTLILIT